MQSFKDSKPEDLLAQHGNPFTDEKKDTAHDESRIAYSAYLGSDVKITNLEEREAYIDWIRNLYEFDEDFSYSK